MDIDDVSLPHSTLLEWALMMLHHHNVVGFMKLVNHCFSSRINFCVKALFCFSLRFFHLDFFYNLALFINIYLYIKLFYDFLTITQVIYMFCFQPIKIFMSAKCVVICHFTSIRLKSHQFILGIAIFKKIVA